MLPIKTVFGPCCIGIERPPKIRCRRGQSPGSDFDDSTIFAVSIGEWNSLVKKLFKANRSYKKGGVMNTEFRYKGPRRELGFGYVGREWGFLAILVLLGMLFVGAIADKVSVTFFIRSFLEILMGLASLR